MNFYVEETITDVEKSMLENENQLKIKINFRWNKDDEANCLNYEHISLTSNPYCS